MERASFDDVAENTDKYEIHSGYADIYIHRENGNICIIQNGIEFLVIDTSNFAKGGRGA